MALQQQVAARWQANMMNQEADFHERLKASELLRPGQVQDMLSSAPLVINLMGHLRLAAFSDAAGRISGGNFKGKCLRNNDLSSNLIQLIQQGYLTFSTAEERMLDLKEKLKNLFGGQGTPFVRLIGALKEADGSALKVYEKRLNTGIDDCIEYVDDVEEQFKNWEEMIYELERFAGYKTGQEVQHRDTQQATRNALKNQEVQVEESLKYYEEKSKRADREYEESKKKEEMAQKKASAWRLFGLKAAANTSNLVFGTVNTALSLAKDVPQVVTAASKTLHFFSESGRGEASTTPDQGPSNAAPASNSTTQAPLDPNDMAYQRAADIFNLATALKGILEGNIEDSQQELSDLSNQIASALLDFEKPASKRSYDARTALRGCKNIVQEAQCSKKTIVLNSDQISNPRLDGWKKECQEALNIAMALESEAANLPGRAFGCNLPTLYPSSFNALDPMNIDAIINERHRESIMMHKAAIEAHETYEVSLERLSKKQSEIQVIALKLEQLAEQELTTNDVIVMLKDTAKTMGTLQNDISRLRKFFLGIRRVTKSICGEQTTSLLDGIHLSGFNRGSNQISELKLQEIYIMWLTIRGQVGAVNEACSFYCGISQTHIVPALRQMNRLPIDAGREEQATARHALTESTEAASKDIVEIGKKHYEALQAKVTEMASSYAAEVRSYMPLPAAEVKIIEDASAEVGRQTRKAIASIPSAAYNLDCGKL
ncbi:hypothetical protein SBOR_7648 [Sclerotinia borealis F-4128]|uniref:Uncharacterized protein n=1 Tax=Sclerotinia borealis (strain F-4128) TaxID=1432307 RepID=W9C811_SCLBF|nr:hypothetical protein SBOR_7648 [Sclerotinia borealis F-4128]